MKVEIHCQQASQPQYYDNVVNAYTKGELYCMLIDKGDCLITHKFPLSTIFRIIEDSGYKKR